MIKTPGGTNVTPAELEAVLATYPDVLEACVGVPAGGTNEVAAAVAAAGESLTDDDVRTRLKGDVQYKVLRYVDLREVRPAVRRLRQDPAPSSRRRWRRGSAPSAPARLDPVSRGTRGALLRVLAHRDLHAVVLAEQLRFVDRQREALANRHASATHRERRAR